MHTHNNPVARKVEDMARLWEKKVQKDTVLVRWLLHPEDSSFYEAFCRVEASAQGYLSEYMLLLYTAFEDTQSYSRAVAQEWIRLYEQDKSAAGAGVPEWDYHPFAQALEWEDENLDTDALLWEMMDSFRQWGGRRQQPLVLALLPSAIASPEQYSRWIAQCMQAPRKPLLRLLVLDHSGANHLGSTCDAFASQAVTLSARLNMQATVREIATTGDAADPEVQFRQCLYKMADAAQSKKRSGVDEWGQKALLIAQKSGHASLQATAHVTYAGMLFSFKAHQEVQQLLDDGIRICLRHKSTAEESLRLILLQAYGYKAADYQYQKQTEQSINYFMLQATEARSMGLLVPCMSAYHKLYALATYAKQKPVAEEALQQVILLTPALSDADIQVSEYPYLAYEYLERAKTSRTLGNPRHIEAVETRMQQIMGDDWKQTVQEMRKNFLPKYIHSLETTR